MKKFVILITILLLSSCGGSLKQGYFSSDPAKMANKDTNYEKCEKQGEATAEKIYQIQRDRLIAQGTPEFKISKWPRAFRNLKYSFLKSCMRKLGYKQKD